ncbi:MAG: type IV pilus assembly protein PilM [Cardiobacteriaceae bacterium]|nr:type IV pilus assembly protein PilM [Cardiobacteriaceae bacterium]
MTDIIGIDIGQYAVKFARIKKTGRSFVCSDLVYEVIPEDIRKGRNKEGMRNIVSNLLKFHKIVKGLPVIHVSSGDTVMRNVNIPDNVTPDQMEGAVELELAPNLPFNIEQVYFDFEEQPSPDGTYLAVAARRDIVDQKTELFENRAKTLDAPEVDVDVFAYERLVESLIESNDVKANTIAIVDVGYAKSRIMVYQNGRYIFSRDAQVGGNQATEMFRDVYDIDMEAAESKKFNLTVDDEYNNLILKPYVASFAEQINLAIDFYEASDSNAKRIERIYLTGGGSLLHGFVDKLSDAVSMPLELLDLKSKLRGKAGNDAIQTSVNHSLAIALAMEEK